MKNFFLLLAFIFISFDAFAKVKIISNTEVFKDTLVGGLSGITYDPLSKSFIVISDDNGRNNDSRFYEIAEDTYDILEMTYLKTNPNYDIDAEGITLLPNGLLAISSETVLPGSDSLIRLYRRDGSQVEELKMPEKFIPRYDKKGNLLSGIQRNQGLESLTSLQGTMILFTANEHPLLQDEMDNKRLVRIVRLIPGLDGKHVANGEFAYPLENDGDNGLVELAAVDEGRLLTLERKFDHKSKKNTVRIFQVDLSTAKSVSDMKTLNSESTPVLEKKLVLDLDDLAETYGKIDNVEGMYLGPKLQNGNYRLTLVSDNNFNPRQLTQILEIEISLFESNPAI